MNLQQGISQARYLTIYKVLFAHNYLHQARTYVWMDVNINM